MPTAPLLTLYPQQRGRLCWGYFGDLPDAAKLRLSTANATKARRQVAFESQRLAFRELNDVVFTLGHEWKDANGDLQNVYVRIEQLIVDYVDNAAATGTLMNQTCPVCKAPKGLFHQPKLTFDARTAAGSRRDFARATSLEARHGRFALAPLTPSVTLLERS